MDWYALVTFGGWIMTGVLVIVGMFGGFDKVIAARRGQNDEVTQNLIQNLQSTVDLQKETIEATQRQVAELTKELHLLQGRNTVLEGLFNGEEGSMMSFLKQSPALLQIARDNYDLTSKNVEEIGSLTKAIETLVAAMKDSRPSTS